MGKLLKLFTRQNDLPTWPADTPLVRFSKDDALTVRDLLEHFLVVGETGAGKTTGAGQAIAMPALRMGFGFLVLTHKTDEMWRWIDYVNRAGRGDDLIVVADWMPWRFNFLDHAYRLGGGSERTKEITDAFIEVMKTAERGGRQQRDSFWTENMATHIFHSLEALRQTGLPINIETLNAMMTTAPHDDQGAVAYRRNSFCQKVLATVQDQRILHYFENVWAQPGAERGQNAGVLSTWGGMAHAFLQDPLREVFCTSTNFTPEQCRDGAIVILGFPVLQYKTAGRIAQLLFKYIFQQEMLRRPRLPWERPVVLWADDCQHFTIPIDNDFFDTARSHEVGGVYLTQSVNAIYREMTPGMHREQGDALMANFTTKIFHRTSDPPTKHWAAEICGKGLVNRFGGNTGYNEGTSTNYGQSRGGSVGGSFSDNQGHGSWSSNWGQNSGENWGSSQNSGTSYGRSWQETEDYLVRPEVFARLASGGPEHNFRVQAVVHKAGRIWHRTGQNFIDVSFRQR